MEKVNRTVSCFTVDKCLLSKVRHDEAFTKHIIEELSNNLARHLVDILSSEGEVIVSMSDVRCQDNNDFATVDYRQYLKWSHLVRCKDCKYWHRELSEDGGIEYFNFSHCEKGLYGDGHNWFCPKGERREEDADNNQI